MAKVNASDGVDMVRRALLGRYVANWEGRRAKVTGVYRGVSGAVMVETTDEFYGFVDNTPLLRVIRNNPNGSEFGNVWADMLAKITFGWDVFGDA